MEEKRFKKKDEGFICESCGKEVLPLGYTSRDHCPHCLCSKHVDINPGDRANDCKGMLVPIDVDKTKKGYVIVYKCSKCSKTVKNIVADDDDFNMIIKVSANK